MAYKTILFMMIFSAAVIVIPFVPIAGIIAYTAHYSLGVDRWWFVQHTKEWGIRYSFILAILTAVSILLHYRGLRFGKKLLVGQEKLILLLLAVIWLSVLIGGTTEPVGGVTELVGGVTELEEGYDSPAMKVTKVVIFILMMTHVVTRSGYLNAIIWVLVLSGLVLGWQAYNAPEEAFGKGRLELIGGPDFREANFLAAYFGGILPLIGIQFLRSKWPGRLLCLACGAFATNGIILTRSRGAVIGVACGLLVAVAMAPKKFRLKIIAGLIVAVLGAWYLVDPGFMKRAKTIQQTPEQADTAISSRLAIWKASRAMLKDQPLGVGAGNFKHKIGNYVPEYAGRDAHSTFVRCYSELGVHGMAVFLVVVGNALWVLRRVQERARKLPPAEQKQLIYTAYGLAVSICTFAACGLTITLLYMEALWWMLALPVCMVRIVENLEADILAPVPVEKPGKSAKAPGKARGSHSSGRARY